LVLYISNQYLLGEMVSADKSPTETSVFIKVDNKEKEK
jgi:hypothetical protein